MVSGNYDYRPCREDFPKSIPIHQIRAYSSYSKKAISQKPIENGIEVLDNFFKKEKLTVKSISKKHDSCTWHEEKIELGEGRVLARFSYWRHEKSILAQLSYTDLDFQHRGIASALVAKAIIDTIQSGAEGTFETGATSDDGKRVFGMLDKQELTECLKTLIERLTKDRAN